ncbi:NAD-dependent epimerase/dehydratase family protein [Aggregatilinea lenta]|uniref:NAD-dependent epimerase/dehydratase family protein n=1 Tax=Aggregatilinea lenta TaxID=913108 RepID=UPI000E5B1686|nr:NAD-dependent epimerase/dehydratase family protein [Aggregatilinea lenta]
MRVLILGAPGNIGTAIIHEFIARGDDVTAFNLPARREAIPPDVHFIAGDRYDFPVFEAQMREEGYFDCVIDMICFDPAHAESAIRAFDSHIGQYIFTSTVDVYCKPATHYPITESEPRRGNNAYARGKKLAEDVFLRQHDEGGFPVTIIRPAFTYGEGGGIVDIFGWSTSVFDRIRKGKPLICHGDGSSFWVANHRDSLAVAYGNAAHNPAALGRIYHVTGEEWLTWNRYFEIIAEAIGAPKPQLVHIPTDVLSQIAPARTEGLVSNFSGNNVFDNTAARTDLGYVYKVTWTEGVRRVYDYLERHGKIEACEENSFQDQIIGIWQSMTSNLP